MKKVFAFDLDGTLAPSKSPLPPEMGDVLGQLLKMAEVCVISGGKFDQFKAQLINGLQVDEALLAKLHIMPTCGTQYYRYDTNNKSWVRQYAENFTEEEKQQIIAALNDGVDKLGYRESKVYGDTVEDRESQITFSALGQDIVAELGNEGVRLKEEWDPDGQKKENLRAYVSEQIPQFEIRAGGSTSIDITKPGIDKAYGMQKLMAMLQLAKEDVLFFGDKLEPGGNDYPVKEMGVESISVRDWRDTLERLRIYV